MRRILLIFLLLLILLCLGRHLLPLGEKEEPLENTHEEDLGAAKGEQGDCSLSDREILLRVLVGEEIMEMSMEEYLPMALAGEMPAAFSPEALKAQAVAIRSYALYCRDHPKGTHTGADVCLSYACCTAGRSLEEAAESWGDGAEEYRSKILKAVSDTDGQFLSYEKEAILAMFHSSSEGATEQSGEILNPLPYLVSVDSPETEENLSNLLSAVEVSAADFEKSILRVCPDADFKGEPSSWLGKMKLTESGRVDSIYVGGREISGLTMRQIFSLRSTDFELCWTGENFLFEVKGFGHGLGMSQYGANIMAKEGADYEEILLHYYPGTELAVYVVRSDIDKA